MPKGGESDGSWRGSGESDNEEAASSVNQSNDDTTKYENDNHDADDEEEEHEKKQAAKPKGESNKRKKKDLGVTVNGLPKKTRKPDPRKRIRKPLNISEEELFEESRIPSYKRKTARGGYAATAAHRLKISKANKGKQPWNTGKNRSQEDINKIREAVNAHHRRKMLANIQSIGMTEEEYIACRKRIKVMRENVRKYRMFNKQKAVKQGEKLLAEKKEKEEQEKDDDETAQESESPTDEKVKHDPDGNREAVSETEETPPKPQGTSPREARSVPERSTAYDIEKVPEIFRRDFEWTPHNIFQNGEVSLEGKCPNGGPGGLVCCDICSATYCDFLTSTYNEMEDQKLTKAAADLETVTSFLELNHNRLTASVRVAQRQPPPSSLGDTWFYRFLWYRRK